MDFITIDFETATSDRDSACEIGLTFVKNFQVVETKSWLIKPLSYPRFDYWNVSVHGIRAEHVRYEKEFHHLWTEIHPLINNQFLIAHNASFDFSVLRKTLDAYRIPYPTLDYACSVHFSKKIWAGLPQYDLKSLCNINNIQFKHHRAAADSRATAELVIKAFAHASISSLEEFSEKLRTTPGKLFLGGYTPAKHKAEKKPRKNT